LGTEDPADLHDICEGAGVDPANLEHARRRADGHPVRMRVDGERSTNSPTGEIAMKQTGQYLGAIALSVTLFSILAFAQAPQGQGGGVAGAGRLRHRSQ